MHPPEPARGTGLPGPRQIDGYDAQALLDQLADEVAGALVGAAERVTSLAATGRISRASLRALRDEVDRARRVALTAQQVSRLASGRVPVEPDRLDLTALLNESVRQRAREIQGRGIELRLHAAPAEVRSDAALLFTLLQAVLDWSFEHARSIVDMRLTVPGWPARALLRTSFDYNPVDEIVTVPAALEGSTDAMLDTLSWRLVAQAAAVLGVESWRRDAGGRTELTLDFRETLPPSLQSLGSGIQPAAENSQPHASRHVLALTPSREVRSLVREALRAMGLMLDFVATVEEARHLCGTGLPDVVIYEAALAGDDLERLLTELRADVSRVGFVRIVDQGKAFEVLNLGDRSVASVGRDAIVESLPAALHFELARAG